MCPALSFLSCGLVLVALASFYRFAFRSLSFPCRFCGCCFGSSVPIVSLRPSPRFSCRLSGRCRICVGSFVLAYFVRPCGSAVVNCCRGGIACLVAGWRCLVALCVLARGLFLFPLPVAYFVRPSVSLLFPRCFSPPRFVRPACSCRRGGACGGAWWCLSCFVPVLGGCVRAVSRCRCVVVSAGGVAVLRLCSRLVCGG